ncbi:MAG: RraA family protein [Candidatus Bathyarchaeia archaeon]
MAPPRYSTNKLSTCNISDALDFLAIKGAVSGVFPLWPSCPKLAGPALTIKLDVRGDRSTAIGTLEAIEQAKKGAVLVIDNGGRTHVNSWGGIASFSAKRGGLAGVVIDGASRDIDEMKRLGFPAYAKGIVQTSVRQRTAFGGFNIPIQCGGVKVAPGDFVMGDENGVVIIPERKTCSVIELAEKFRKIELGIKQEIKRGVSPVMAHESARYDFLIKGT